jgi:hypothetical protein
MLYLMLQYILHSHGCGASLAPAGKASAGWQVEHMQMQLLVL